MKHPLFLAAPLVAAIGLPIFACSSSSSSAPQTTVATGCSTAAPSYVVASNSTASAATCSAPGSDDVGAADMHCVGVSPQPTSLAVCCETGDAGDDSSDTADAGIVPGQCGENDGDYATTMSGMEGDDDDCKYHVSWTSTPICEQTDGVFFTVTATSKVDGSPLTGAAPQAELCLSNTHPAPIADSIPPQGGQRSAETAPGVYTIGPVAFDAAGKWTVRFHFFEQCYDVLPNSPHGHAAFFVNVP